MNKSPNIRLPKARGTLPFALETETKGNRAGSVIAWLGLIIIALLIAYFAVPPIHGS